MPDIKEMKADLTQELEDINGSLELKRASISSARAEVRTLLEEKKGVERLLNAINRKPRVAKPAATASL